jgi:hypothetical protein
MRDKGVNSAGYAADAWVAGAYPGISAMPVQHRSEYVNVCDHNSAGSWKSGLA